MQPASAASTIHHTIARWRNISGTSNSSKGTGSTVVSSKAPTNTAPRTLAGRSTLRKKSLTADVRLESLSLNGAARAAAGRATRIVPPTEPCNVEERPDPPGREADGTSLRVERHAVRPSAMYAQNLARGATHRRRCRPPGMPGPQQSCTKWKLADTTRAPATRRAMPPATRAQGLQTTGFADLAECVGPRVCMVVADASFRSPAKRKTPVAR